MAAPPRIAVVVASSRVGKAAIEALVETISSDPRYKDTTIRAVLRDSSKADPQWPSQGVEVVSGLSTDDPASLASAFSGVNRAFIVAPQVETRADVVDALLTSAQAQGVCHVALIGGVFQEEERFLFHRHWMRSRRRAQELKLSWTQLECSDFMENLLGSCGSIQLQGKLVGAFPDGVSSPVALQDIGRAAAAVLLGGPSQHGNRAYRIVGLQALSPRQVVAAISDVTGRRVEFEDVGLEASKQRALAAGRLPWQVEGFADWQTLYFATGRLGEVKSDLPLLGVQPVLLEDWLKERVHLFAPAKELCSA